MEVVATLPEQFGENLNRGFLVNPWNDAVYPAAFLNLPCPVIMKMIRPDPSLNLLGLLIMMNKENKKNHYPW